MEYSYEVKIPKERIAVLIGKKGSEKKELEEATSSKIEVDSKEGDVKVSGEDSLKIFALREVVKAIGRGFNPDIARLLLKQDYVLELIPVQDFVPNKNHLERIKGRVIGAKGKSRDTIEKMTETFVSVYGKTIGIIGSVDRVGVAKQAIESLLNGSPHSNVYTFLERSNANLKKEEAINWYQSSPSKNDS